MRVNGVSLLTQCQAFAMLANWSRYSMMRSLSPNGTRWPSLYRRISKQPITREKSASG